MADQTTRRMLPLLGRPGGRSRMTCVYRCGDQCAHPAPNLSDNEYFGDIVARQVSRRGLLRTGALGALGAVAVTGAAPRVDAATAAAARAGRGHGSGALAFPPVPPNTRDDVVVANGYEYEVVIRWGDPVLPGAPDFDLDDQSAAAQERQFGYNCDFVYFFALGHGFEAGHAHERALLWVNHEYTSEELMFRGYAGGDTATEEQIQVAMAAHGGSVVEIERSGRSGRWRPVRPSRGRYNRRITAHTPMRFTGPAAGSELLRTAADPAGRRVLGMLNNCAGGTTPWGTVLTCEENFHQYFVGGNGAPEEQKPALERYGIDTTNQIPDDNRRWDRVEERFDIAEHPHEPNRFGWVVEIDPYDPAFVPRKRTHLGRLKHECANTTLTKDGRLAAYTGDDEVFEYMYKFVSAQRYRPGNSPSARRHNSGLLDEGTLYVARFDGDSPPAEIDGTGALPSDGQFDGVGVWIPLASGDTSHVPGMTADEVYVYTRFAADEAGGTKMDRPEDIERNPRTGAVYAALTKNGDRTEEQVDEVNPRANNRHGQVLELVEERNDAGATRFGWSLPLVCGDPDDPSTYFAGYDKSKVSPISCPDNVTFDRHGNLWVSTDGNALGSNDGLFAMPVRGHERGHVRQFLTVPVGAETCGPLITPDQRTVFVAVQHPGEVDGSTVENPASTWPGGEFPQPSVVCAYRPDGKHIGT